MAAPQATTKRGRIVSMAVLYALCFGAPAAVLAGNNNPGDGGQKKDVLEFATIDLRSIHGTDSDEVEPAASEAVEVDDPDLAPSRLSPAIEAALRKAAEPRPAINGEPVDPPAMKTRVPGLSDEAMARYKLKMLRKDI